MFSFQKIIFLILIMFTGINGETLPLTQRYFHTEDMGYDYSRGTYLIVLADSSLGSEDILGDFIHFKQTQGYNVKIVSFENIGGTKDYLRTYLQIYYEDIDPMLEYVLLIGDINGTYAIPSYTIQSYNEADLDVTDHPYTYFGNDPLAPNFFIGRWSIRTLDDLKKIKMRSIQYIKMDSLNNHSFLNNALLVAGNFQKTGTWPVTPVMTSKWLMDELHQYGYNTIDTAFYHLNNTQEENPKIALSWNSGVGIINYRGWGDANGWKKPHFFREDVDPGLQNGWQLPIVMSFVCNTGDFGNDLNSDGLDKCFGEVLTTGGSINNPKGAAAMIGPSDLDTDTRFNNIMCAVMWDELLEGRVPELAPALHAGKQGLIKEFGNLKVNNTKIVEFYHHVYGVLGDPSLPVWLGEPKNMIADIESNSTLISSYVSTIVKDEKSGAVLMDVVGALLFDGELISKGLSNSGGELVIDFSSEYANSELKLFLNKDQFLQKEITLITQDINNDSTPENSYIIPLQNTQYRYEVNVIEYNWIEIKGRAGTDPLVLTDDSITEVDMDLSFMYYGETYNTMTVCSNGWVSFEPCLKPEGSNYACNSLSYFFNNSITAPLGPYGMIAPFFDDLDDNNGNEPFEVYFFSNSDSIIVQWDNVANGQHDEFCVNNDPLSCPRHTFQLILDKSQTDIVSNGDITFQYKKIEDVDDHGSTIGIESPEKNTGTEFLFNESPQSSAQLLQDGLAIIFTQICDGPIGFDECDCSGNKIDCNGECGGSAVVDNCGVCGGDNSSCILGCTYFGAENYNPEATKNDGSCEIMGCTNVYASQYNASANHDDGSCILSIQEDFVIPQTFALSSFPNPFNPVMTVSFAAPEMGLISVNVFDIRGRRLASLAEQNYKPGYYTVNWDASAYASGVYFITLVTSNIKLTQKILLLK